MLKATIDTGSMWLAIFAVLMAAISVYYYFRLIQAMYFKEGGLVNVHLSSGFKFIMIVVAFVTIMLGLFPNILTTWLYF